ncbi:MAG: BolA family transcriptional regulator [Betaproteobacteria bacterium]|nr:BolA family transcriptional regulator [Betaproteobacteria bacterium]NCA16109.1 BolA family transcriptional regulator [Betaproteobacteria bacterium]
MTLREEIEARLNEVFSPDWLAVWDDSESHRGHAGAASGGGHFIVTIQSDVFVGKSRIQRHRLVYDAVSDWIPARIHALSIDARCPSEPL